MKKYLLRTNTDRDASCYWDRHKRTYERTRAGTLMVGINPHYVRPFYSGEECCFIYAMPLRPYLQGSTIFTLKKPERKLDRVFIRDLELIWPITMPIFHEEDDTIKVAEVTIKNGKTVVEMFIKEKAVYEGIKSKLKSRATGYPFIDNALVAEAPVFNGPIIPEINGQ